MAPIEWHPGFLAALSADDTLRHGNPPASSVEAYVEKMSDRKALSRIISAHSGLRSAGGGSDTRPNGCQHQGDMES